MASISLDYENAAYRRERLTNTMSIIELDGKERTVTLSVSSLPKKGVAWGMDQRVVTRWPAGSPQATQQLLGATMIDTKMNGVWRRTWLGKHPVSAEENGTEFKIIYPKTLRDLFFDILNQGSLLHVTWASITRMGRLANFTATHDREDDIYWEANFTWVNAGNMFPKRMISTRDVGVKSEVQGLLLISDSIDQMESTEIAINPRKRRKDVPKLTIGQVRAFLKAPKTLVDGVGRKLRALTNQIREVADLATLAKSMPYEINNSILATSENILATCNQFHDEFTRIPPEQHTYDRRVSSLAKTASYYAEGTRQTENMARVSAELKMNSIRRRGKDGTASSRTIESGDLLALHLVRVGETLASISLKYYGSPDRVVDLMRANKISPPITSVTTEDGRPSLGGKSLLLIPRL